MHNDPHSQIWSDQGTNHEPLMPSEIVTTMPRRAHAKIFHRCSLSSNCLDFYFWMKRHHKLCLKDISVWCEPISLQLLSSNSIILLVYHTLILYSLQSLRPIPGNYGTFIWNTSWVLVLWYTLHAKAFQSKLLSYLSNLSSIDATICDKENKRHTRQPVL